MLGGWGISGQKEPYASGVKDGIIRREYFLLFLQEERRRIFDES